MIKKKILKLFLRVGLSLVFLVILFNNADVVDTMKSLAKSNHSFLLLGVIVYIIGQLLSAYKWKLLAGAAGFRNKLTEYFDYYFVGMFFNLFLPTTVGGDIARCYYLSKGDPNSRKAPAIYSVLADRATGVAVIVWMAAITLFYPVGNAVPFNIKLFMVFLSLSIIVCTIFFPVLCRTFLNNKKWIRKLLRDIDIYWSNPKLITIVLLWSLFFHIIIVGIHVIIGKAVGLDIPIAYYLIVYPMSAIAGFVPITFNGLGLREATYIYFLSLAGVKSSDSLAFGIFWFGIVLCSSLVGGIFYIKGKRTPPPEEFDIESEIEEETIEEQVKLDEQAESSTV